MRPVSRATLPAAASTLLPAGTAASVVAQSPARCIPQYTPPAGTTAQPMVVPASNVSLAMVIAPDSVSAGGCRFARDLYEVAGYPGGYVPPTLRIRPGATLQLAVVNAMSTDPARADPIYHGTTNFHFHGFNVTGGSRNDGDQVVAVAYDAGAVHPYRFTLPADHLMGMHPYHPHPHAVTDEPVGGGMSGAFLVGDLRLTRLPGNRTLPERVLLFKAAVAGDGASVLPFIVLFHEDHGMMKNVCVYPGLRERGGRTTGPQWCDSQLATAGM